MATKKPTSTYQQDANQRVNQQFPVDSSLLPKQAIAVKKSMPMITKSPPKIDIIPDISELAPESPDDDLVIGPNKKSQQSPITF